MTTRVLLAGAGLLAIVWIAPVHVAASCAWMSDDANHVDTGAGTFYVWSTQVWEETNGWPTLQRGPCVQDGVHIPPDQCVFWSNVDAAINCASAWAEGRGL